jgi:hypothetical protein
MVNGLISSKALRGKGSLKTLQLAGNIAHGKEFLGLCKSGTNFLIT